MFRSFFIFFVFIGFSVCVKATTWFPAKHKCPLCKYECDYREIGSYGSYIYQWPSKFQYLFWPYTDSPTFYCCPKCCFSTYMWDFDSIPEIKIDTLRKFLKTVKLDKKYKDYIEIPVCKRIEIAENVYRILGRNTDFWCKFYRVMGYHYEENKNNTKAKECRLIALHLALQMLSDTSYAGQKKVNYFIIAAMYKYTGEKDSVESYLEKAKSQVFLNEKWKEDEVKGFNEYMDGLISQYKEFIRKGEED